MGRHADGEQRRAGQRRDVSGEYVVRVGRVESGLLDEFGIDVPEPIGEFVGDQVS